MVYTGSAREKGARLQRPRRFMSDKIPKRNHKFEQELWEAIRGLASNSDNIKKRLETAYVYHIVYLEPDSIPQERNRNKLVAIKNKLTKNHTAGVAEAIHHLPRKSCSAMVSDLCDIYWEFIHFEWNQHPDQNIP
jgi:hypothetical protein